MSSAPPDPFPQYVYKIVPAAPPEPIPSLYPLSELDQQDGFIHLSLGYQIPITSGLFFKDSTELWVLKIQLGGFEKSTVDWDVPGCPHLYGNFGPGDVESVKRFTRAEGQGWKDAMAAEAAWLE